MFKWIKMMIIIILIILKFTNTYQQSYDEDADYVLPSSLTQHSPIDEPATTFFAQIGGCTCRQTPDELVVCLSENCYNFPVGLQISTPLFKLQITKILVIKRDDMLSLSNIEALEIESNLRLVKIEPGSFRTMKRLTNLTILNNFNLVSLEIDVFEGLENLKILDLSKNGFTRVIDATRALSPKYVPNLHRLELNENIFDHIEEHEFYPMNGTSLQQLNLILCQIEYIHPACLAPFRKLNFLRIGQNLFNRTTVTHFVQKTLEMGIPLDNLNLYEVGLRRVLPMALLTAVGKTNMSYLSLAANNFDYVDDDSIPDMPYLSDLDLRSCLIINISPNAFKRMPRLEGLRLSFNKLSGVPRGVLIPTLLELTLAGNSDDGEVTSFFSIEDYMFVNMTHLYNLQLSYNNIVYITKNTFTGLRNLTVLGLKNCSLYKIETETFLPLSNLLHLNLANNPLLSVTLVPETFIGLGNLHVLLLGGCTLNNLTSSPNLFSNMPNLTYLGLDRNGLHTIAPNQFNHLYNLLRIDLHENKLTAWTESILPRSPLILFLGGENKFTYITTAMLEDWSTVETLDLDGNPLSCDCSLYSMYVWINENKQSAKYMIGRNLTGKCVGPEPSQRKYIRDCLQNMTQILSDCENLFVANRVLLLAFLVTILILLMILIVLCYMFRWYFGYWLFLYRIKWKQRSIWKAKRRNAKNDCITYQYDAFVSYCSEDRNFVMRLVAMLENYEPYLKLCVYERDFQIGSVISEAILESVAVSKRTLLIISDAFAKSHWCRWETQLAEYHQLFFCNERTDEPDDTLLMVKLQTVCKENLTPTLKYLMKTRIYLEWDPDPKKQREFWKKLRNTLAAPKGESNNTKLLEITED